MPNTVFLSAGSMQPSNYFLDNFVAHKLSLLTECGAPEISSQNGWLNLFILTTVFKAAPPQKKRTYIFNFLRRSEGAFFAYQQARLALLEYVQSPRNVISPYFRALLNFEVCISQCYQGYELLKTATGEKLYEPNDKSEMERLRALYVASKHMDRMIDGGKIPTKATAALWITNQGLESVRASVSFTELTDLLASMGRLADTLSKLEPPTSNQSLNSDASPEGGSPVS
jgi:hypothetical protein